MTSFGAGWFAPLLERGALRGRPAGALARAWGALAAPRTARPLTLPQGLAVIGVGGPTLGGSGKTPVAIALARALALRGSRVAVVGHAYGARPRVARVVHESDLLGEVGDEALLTARALRDLAVPVIVGPSRQVALDFAAKQARPDVLIVDGLLQTRPTRLSLSILVADATAPWGAGSLPPLGDLRAPTHALLEACDVRVLVRDERERGHAEGGEGRGPTARDLYASSRIEGTRTLAGDVLPLDELRQQRLGLILGIARPHRVGQSLALRGIRASCTLRIPDHAAPTAHELRRAGRLTEEHGLSGWLSTAKCATRLPESLGGVPVLPLVHEIALDLPQLAASKNDMAELFCRP